MLPRGRRRPALSTGARHVVPVARICPETFRPRFPPPLHLFRRKPPVSTRWPPSGARRFRVLPGRPLGTIWAVSRGPSRLPVADCPDGSGGRASDRLRDPHPARGARPARRPQAHAAGTKKPFHVPDGDVRPRSPRAPTYSSFSLGQAGHPGRAEESQACQAPGQREARSGCPTAHHHASPFVKDTAGQHVHPRSTLAGDRNLRLQPVAVSFEQAGLRQPGCRRRRHRDQATHRQGRRDEDGYG